MDKIFDFIIVGGGSSGCVLANRLSANPRYSVLLIEAGPPDKSWKIHMPKGYGLMYKSDELIWHYDALPGGGGRNTSDHWLRGKTLGGSSSVNGMMYLRGHPEDYNAWERDLGLKGWGWDKFLNAYLSFEDHELGATEFRGAGGPLHISLTRNRSFIMDKVIAAAGDLGVRRAAEPNEPEQECMSYCTGTIKNGRRWSAAKAFLDPARNRPNLTIVTETFANALIMEGRRVAGIRCNKNGTTVDYRAGREVILAAGTLQTPKILQLSGVGPAKILAPLGIQVVQDSPRLGGNMREHISYITQYRLNQELSQNKYYHGMRMAIQALKYLLFRRGLLDGPAYDVTGFIKTTPDAERPDTQLISSPFSLKMEQWTDLMGNMDIETAPGVSMMACLMQPESQGTAYITSRDPGVPIELVHNYLTAEHDKKVAVGIVRYIRKLFEQPSIKPYIHSEITPGPSIQTDQEILQSYNRLSGSGQHSTGTCSMGSDESSVVDERLRVRGLTGIRVADLSIFPTLVTGNTNAPAMAAAWIASDIILQDAA